MKNCQLKIIMFERSITQEALATATGIPRAYISLAINGKFNFDIEQKYKIAAFLGVDAGKIFNLAMGA